MTGSGSTRLAEGTWAGADTTANLDFPPARRQGTAAPGDRCRRSRGGPACSPSVAARAGDDPTIGERVQFHRASRSARGTAGASRCAPRRCPPISTPRFRRLGVALAANAAPQTEGLSALAYYERAGMLKRIVPLRGPDPSAAPSPRLPAAQALMFAPRLDLAGRRQRRRQLHRDRARPGRAATASGAGQRPERAFRVQGRSSISRGGSRPARASPDRRTGNRRNAAQRGAALELGEDLLARKRTICPPSKTPTRSKSRFSIPASTTSIPT